VRGSRREASRRDQESLKQYTLQIVLKDTDILKRAAFAALSIAGSTDCGKEGEIWNSMKN
jgi:hypothetical protein